MQAGRSLAILTDERAESLEGQEGRCLGHHRRTITELEKLTGVVRASIGRHICEPYRDD